MSRNTATSTTAHIIKRIEKMNRSPQDATYVKNITIRGHMKISRRTVCAVTVEDK